MTGAQIQESMGSCTEKTIAAIVPCYRVGAHLAKVLDEIPEFIEHVIVVDEASAGAVMLAGLPFIAGNNCLLHAASYEMLGSFNHRVSGTPRKP
jgi:hypothetical protein